MGLYSHYDGAHNHPVNRALHMIAIPLGFSSLIVVWFHWIIALLLIPAAFALAWLGHLIEGNQPAFLTNPAHVFVAPVWMTRRFWACNRKSSSWTTNRSVGSEGSSQHVSSMDMRLCVVLSAINTNPFRDSLAVF